MHVTNENIALFHQQSLTLGADNLFDQLTSQAIRFKIHIILSIFVLAYNNQKMGN